MAVPRGAAAYGRHLKTTTTNISYFDDLLDDRPFILSLSRKIILEISVKNSWIAYFMDTLYPCKYLKYMTHTSKQSLQ